MTKQNWIDNFKIVIEPVVDKIEIQLKDFTPFLNAVRDVADDYDIHMHEVEAFVKRHIDEFRGLIGEKVSVQSKLGWHE